VTIPTVLRVVSRASSCGGSRSLQWFNSSVKVMNQMIHNRVRVHDMTAALKMFQVMKTNDSISAVYTYSSLIQMDHAGLHHND
jgi:hypothetical protein